MTETVPFVHLHVHTEYSLLDGANRIKPLISRVKELGMKHIAITDHGNMFGVMDFYKVCRAEGINPVIGCEVYVAPRDRHEQYEVEGTRYYHLILLAENNEGYRNLVQLVSRANTEGMYYKPRVDKELLRKYSKGLICLSACIAGEVPAWIIRGDMFRAEKALQEYLEIFGRENYFIEIQNHGMPEEKRAVDGLIALAAKYGLGLAATNDAHYLKREDSEFHEVLLCIQTGKTLADQNRMRFFSDDFYLKTQEEMQGLFGSYPEALANTVKIAERCHVEFDFEHRHLPNFPLPEGLTAGAYLRQLCEKYLPERYGHITGEVRERLDYELDVIHNMGFDSYFLIVWDFINYARSVNIPVGPGRGSAAGSIVAYALGITDLDPLAYDLLFERFLNPERVTMPDIDIDFCYVRREEVIDYVKKRYGDDNVSQIITFGTLKAKNAVRDVARAMGMSYAEGDRVVKLIPSGPKVTLQSVLDGVEEFRRLYEDDANVQRLVDMARRVEDVIALYNPVAIDLRFVLAMLKINTNLERLGDFAEGIARFVLKSEEPILDGDLLKRLRLEEMQRQVLSMLEVAKRALNEESLELATSVFAKDNLLDEINAEATAILADYIREHPESTLSCLNLVGVFRKLERSGDHITNIAEEIVFFIDAKVLKHSGKVEEHYPDK